MGRREASPFGDLNLQDPNSCKSELDLEPSRAHNDKGSQPPYALMEDKTRAKAYKRLSINNNNNNFFNIKLKEEQGSKHVTSPLTYTFHMTQWNARSIDSEVKANFIRGLPGDFLAVQEIWNRIANLRNLEDILSFIQRSGKRGGGSAIIHRFPSCPLTCRRVTLNKDSEAVKVRIGCFFVWLVNCYLAKGSFTKIQRFFARLRMEIPINEWGIICLLGDFNIDISLRSQESELFRSLCKQMGLQIELPMCPTRETATLDFLVIGASFSLLNHDVYPSPSDHNAVSWQLSVLPTQRLKLSRIPCRFTADAITETLLRNKRVKRSQDFIEALVAIRIKNRKYLTKRIKLKKTRSHDLMKALLELGDDTPVCEVISKYWKRFWKQSEALRFTQASKETYNSLKRILKYHLFEKRDGGIITSILRDDGKVCNDPEEIDELLMLTMAEIQVDNNREWIKEEKFPSLPVLLPGEVEGLIQLLSTNKATAWDGVSDLLFNKSRPVGRKGSSLNFAQITASKLRDLWSIDLDSLSGIAQTWAARLVPLNKVFPAVPTRTQLRPIIVQSPLVKLLEARFLPKLQDYLCYKLDRSQVGFVKNMGVQINLTRVLERITLRTRQKVIVFGLFVDFSNAYNSVPHSLLFSKLRQKRILTEDEVCFIEQLYARYRIKLGSRLLKTNKGVAQGSVLSPALFDVFMEDLGDDLTFRAGIDMEDRLFYADDVLLLVTSEDQLIKAVSVVEEWAKKNGMSLNKSKSGVVVFANRKATKVPKMEKIGNAWKPTEESI